MERTLYREEALALTEEEGELFLRTGGEVYRLGEHPYDLSTRLYRGEALRALIRNAFTLGQLRSLAEKGGTAEAATGSRYDIGRVCRLLAFAAANCPDCDISYAEGAVALEELKRLGALSPETAVKPEAAGVRRISDVFSHSRRRTERIMTTEDGRVYVRIKERPVL